MQASAGALAGWVGAGCRSKGVLEQPASYTRRDKGGETSSYPAFVPLAREKSARDILSMNRRHLRNSQQVNGSLHRPMFRTVCEQRWVSGGTTVSSPTCVRPCWEVNRPCTPYNQSMQLVCVVRSIWPSITHWTRTSIRVPPAALDASLQVN